MTQNNPTSSPASPAGPAALGSTVVNTARNAASLVPLGPWLDLCAAARVPYIPAIFSEPFPTRQMYNAIDREGDTAAIGAAIEWADRLIAIETADGRRRMFRYECGCTSAVKYHLAKSRTYDDPDPLYTGMGGEPVNPFHIITVEDPRIFDIMVGQTQRLCVRPFIDPLIIDGYPLEFRAYVGPQGLLGISSYFPQRPLDIDSPIDLRPFLDAVERHASALYVASAHYVAGIAVAGFPIGFTADFLVAEDPFADPRVLFLEGGPPHHDGPINAHPCCFAPGHISGVALAPRPGALTR